MCNPEIASRCPNPFFWYNFFISDQVRSFLPTRLQKASRHVFFPSGLQSSSSSNFSAGPADSVCYSIVIQSSSCLFQTKLSQPVLPLLKPQHGFPVFDNNFLVKITRIPWRMKRLFFPTHSASVLFSFWFFLPDLLFLLLQGFSFFDYLILTLLVCTRNNRIFQINCSWLWFIFNSINRALANHIFLIRNQCFCKGRFLIFVFCKNSLLQSVWQAV